MFKFFCQPMHHIKLHFADHKADVIWHVHIKVFMRRLKGMAFRGNYASRKKKKKVRTSSLY